MLAFSKKNMIQLQRTTVGDDCWVPSAIIPAANQASPALANSAVVEQRVVATRREKSGGKTRERQKEE